MHFASVGAAFATKTAEANNNLAKGAKDPGTLYLRCLELTEKMLSQGKQLPASWNCSGQTPQQVVPIS